MLEHGSYMVKMDESGLLTKRRCNLLKPLVSYKDKLGSLLAGGQLAITHSEGGQGPEEQAGDADGSSVVGRVGTGGKCHHALSKMRKGSGVGKYWYCQ